MKTNSRILIIFSVLMILVMILSTACLNWKFLNPGRSNVVEADELLDELIDESSSDSGKIIEGEAEEQPQEGNGGDEETNEPEKKVSFVDLHDGDMKLASVDWMLESLYPAAMNDDRAKVVFFRDEKGDWKYSILSETPGVQVAQNDLVGWGFWTMQTYPGWSGPPPDEVFPCDGDHTICAQDRPNNPWGDYHVVYAVHDGTIETIDVEKIDPNSLDFVELFEYSVALDADGEQGNNFTQNAPYDGDYFHETDRQYTGLYNPKDKEWYFHAMGQNFAQFPTDARMVINDNVVFWLIPTSDFPIQAPAARVTTFLSTGDYNPENCGYDTNGEDPTDNLTPLSADPIYLLDQEDLLVGMAFDGKYTLLGPGDCKYNEKPVEGQKTEVWCSPSSACSSRKGRCNLFSRAIGDPPQDPDSWHYVAEANEKMQKDWDYAYNCFCVK